ncbi:MAG: PspA/IM30 family protein [Fimbriimonadaceae bacterium]|nr:PspA/IM30 family protein [Fimbriimonadaceae bacterium]
MKRFFAWLRAIFHRGMDSLEDPEIMLDQARRDMQGALVANREKAVQAIAQRNRLQKLMDEQTQRSTQLENQAAAALKSGNRDLARQFLREKAGCDQSIESLKPTLATATETVEQVKIAIKRQEEEVRRKYAEALALKAQWKQAQIQSSITQALEGLTFENQYEGSFAAARDKIADKQAEAAARTEMLSGSIQGKMMQMEDQAMDYAADEELRALEEKLGLGPKVSEDQVASSTPADESLVDEELEALEKRLQQGQ